MTDDNGKTIGEMTLAEFQQLSNPTNPDPKDAAAQAFREFVQGGRVIGSPDAGTTVDDGAAAGPSVLGNLRSGATSGPPEPTDPKAEAAQSVRRLFGRD